MRLLGGNVSNSEESQTEAKSHSRPHPQSEAIKNNSTKQQNKLKGKEKSSHLGKKINQSKPALGVPHSSSMKNYCNIKEKLQASQNPDGGKTKTGSRLSGKYNRTYTLINLTENKEEITSAPKRHKATTLAWQMV